MNSTHQNEEYAYNKYVYTPSTAVFKNDFIVCIFILNGLLDSLD